MSVAKGIFLGVSSDEYKFKTHWSVPIPVCKQVGDPKEGKGVAELHLLVARLGLNPSPLIPSLHRILSPSPL